MGNFKFKFIKLLTIIFISTVISVNLFTIFPVHSKVTFSSVIKKVAPAVVSIYASNIVNKSNSHLNNDHLYEHIFGKDKNSSYSLGSGVIVNEDGLIITNAHVVDQRNNITVILNNGKEYKAKKLSVNCSIDLALLKINNKDDEKFAFLDVKDEKDSTEVGDLVLAIGNPFGIGQTVSSGIVSGFRYFEKGEEVGFGKLIQLDAAINPGNSGGALVNSDGELIGINSNIYTYNNNSASGIGFAIPASVVKLFIKRYYSGGSLKKYWIGLTGLSVDNEISSKLNLRFPNGVYVNNVIKDAPADQANIKKGDVIIKIDEININTMSDLAFAIARIDSPDPITIKFIRKNKEMKTSLIPELPREEPKKELYDINKGVLKGTVFANNSPLVAYEINSDLNQQGVVIYKLSNTSLLRKLGIEVGDTVSKIDDKDIYTTKDIKDYIESTSNNYNSYKIVLKRRNQSIHLNINK